MNTKAVVGFSLMLGFTLLLFMSFGQQVGGYMDFTEARASGTEAHVVGTWVEDAPMTYDRHTNRFTFHMKDEQGNVQRIIYGNPKPPNFEEADRLVIQGQMADDHFRATHILVKCPSKYNGQKSFSAEAAM